MKAKKQHEREHNPIRVAVRYILEMLQSPRLLKEGDSAWKAMTVPQGRSFTRLAALPRVLSTIIGLGTVGGIRGGDRCSSCASGIEIEHDSAM